MMEELERNVNLSDAEADMATLEEMRINPEGFEKFIHMIQEEGDEI